MSSPAKEAWGGAYTITPNASYSTVANNAYYASPVQDNSSGGYLDAEIIVVVQTGATAPAAGSVWYAFLAGSPDGTTWPDLLSGAEGNPSLTAQGNIAPIGTITVGTGVSTTYHGPHLTLSRAGVGLPYKWQLLLQNATGQSGSVVKIIVNPVYVTVG